MTLLAKLEAAGLDVQPYGNWINRGNTWGLNYGKPQPAGIMHHATRNCRMGRMSYKQTHRNLYWVWENMRSRCNNPNDPEYSRYGGRGIQVAARWDSFANFLQDVGDRPPDPEWWNGERAYWSIDRIDNDGDYEPGNLKWATPTEQALNRRQRASCRVGHPYDEDNTYIRPDGTGRGCKKCRNEAAARYRARRK